MTPSATINIRGRLVSLDIPKVMGILNVTSDSFYAGCRTLDEDGIAARIAAIRDEGADIIDIGACSTRPGSDPVPADVEERRLLAALDMVRSQWPDAIISVDTFRADIARKCFHAGADIINDISGGADPLMFDVMAEIKAPYILTHFPTDRKDTPDGIADPQGFLASVISWFAFTVKCLRERGVCDIILDPGFGFGKSVEENYLLMANLKQLKKIGLPLLVGISRKSMIYRPLGITPAEALPGTVTLDAVALLNGADIIRVHDVADGVQTRNVVKLLTDHSS